jgi:microcystin-dependent protein
MADPFVAEIRILPFNQFAPKGWAFCDGQLMAISQNTALFSLLGTNYGGDGKSTFGLPDMQGRAPMNQGQSTTGINYDVGQASGTDTVTLLESEIPVHNHSIRAVTDPAELQIPTPNRAIARSANANAYKTTTTNLVQMAATMLSPAGGSLPHNNRMPYLTLSFCIALQGVFPPRS